MEEKRKEAFPEEPTSTARDAPPPYSADQYSGAAPGYGQLPPAQGYHTAQPYPPTQQYPPSQQQYGYPQPPHGYSGAPVTVQPITQVQPVRVQPRLKEDYYLMSILLSVLWCVLWAPYLLVCTIPAIFIARKARMMARNGDVEGGKQKAQNALYCNIASIVCAVFGYVTLVVIVPILGTVIPVAIAAASANNKN